MDAHDDLEAQRLQDQRRDTYAAIFINVIITAVIVFCQGLYNRMDYHTSILSGYGWVLELLTGHPDRIRCELGVRVHVFDALLSHLQEMGYSHSRNVTLKEQLAIFLYGSVTGLSVRHLGERFQHSNETICKYDCLTPYMIPF
jgi:hypothetical protein